MILKGLDKDGMIKIIKLRIFTESKYIPLMWGGFVLDLELVNNASDPIISTPAGITADNTSTEWQISDFVLSVIKLH